MDKKNNPHTNDGESRRIWNYKLSKYLAYCFNGGLMGRDYSLKDLFDILNDNNISSDLRSTCLTLIDYFLYA